MKPTEFASRIEEFAELYCPEYMRVYAIEVDMTDPDNPTAEIKAEDYFGRHWSIPFCVGDDNEIYIDTGGDIGGLKFNGEGFYCYLWHEAASRANIQKEVKR